MVEELYDVAVLPGVIRPSVLGFRTDGIAVDDRSGASVAGAGDVNGDGTDDLIIAALRAGSYYGESYVVVFGFGPGPPPITGGPGRDVLAGTDAGEAFSPDGDYDFVTTGGGSDTISFDLLRNLGATE